MKKAEIILQSELYRQRIQYTNEQVRQWEAIGGRVTDSGFDMYMNQPYSWSEIKKAFLSLGVNFNEMPGTKWYEFFTDETEVKYQQALEELNKIYEPRERNTNSRRYPS